MGSIKSKLVSTWRLLVRSPPADPSQDPVSEESDSDSGPPSLVEESEPESSVGDPQRRRPHAEAPPRATAIVPIGAYADGTPWPVGQVLRVPCPCAFCSLQTAMATQHWAFMTLQDQHLQQMHVQDSDSESTTIYETCSSHGCSSDDFRAMML